MTNKYRPIFITGIDTEIGKTVVTGIVAKHFLSIGLKVTTMKPVQTGCSGIAEDIVSHRKIMGVQLDEYDLNGLTAPLIFKFPGSPHLAAELEGREVDLNLIDKSLKILEENFDLVLIEGAGGIYVPLSRSYTTVDFIADRNFPVIVVSSPKLGSINHTMMTLETLKNRKITILALVYNMYPKEKVEITDDSINVIKELSERIGLYFPVFVNPFQQSDSDNEKTLNFNKMINLLSLLHT